MNSFSIIKELGGQKNRKFSKVFHVSRNSDNKDYVLKLVEKNESTTLQQKKLIQESKFKLPTPYFQETIDFWEDGNRIYLLKEFIPGITLTEWINNNKKSNIIELIQQFINGIAPTFDYLRLNQIAHNDIKPSNFLVREQTNSLEFILIDFGLAFNYPSNDDDEILFSLGYSSPELILSKKSLVNHASDIYSLGILLYQMYSGKLPLTHANPTVFTNLQITHPILNQDNLPKDLFEIIAQMCLKHSFRLPPNQLEEKEVENCLRRVRDDRLTDIIQIKNKINLLRKKNWWNVF